MTLLLWCPVFSTMHSLSVLFSAVTLFLVLCLQLGISKAQDGIDVRQPLLFYLEVPKSAKSGELITVKLGLETEYKECLVVKAYLESPTPMEGNFNFHQTRCLCDDYRVNFLWDFPVYRSVRFAVKVDITDDKNICPDDVAVIPITGSGYHTFRTVSVN